MHPWGVGCGVVLMDPGYRRKKRRWILISTEAYRTVLDFSPPFYVSTHIRMPCHGNRSGPRLNPTLLSSAQPAQPAEPAPPTKPIP